MLPSIAPENVAVSAAEMLGAAGVTNVAKRATPSTPDWTIHEVGFARTGKGCTTVDPRNLCGYVLSLLGGWDNGGSISIHPVASLAFCATQGGAVFEDHDETALQPEFSRLNCERP